MKEHEIKALQDELAAAKARIIELEACVDDANGHCAWAEADGKKWKARLRWFVKSLSKIQNDKCIPPTYRLGNAYGTLDGLVLLVSEYADKEMGK